MKIILFFFSLFLSVTYTQATETNVYKLLISGETKQIKQAAKIMSKGNQNTPENALILAGILDNEFKNAPSNRIDALSWGCTALGSTGDSQYKALLKKIYESEANNKLRKYANKAYKRLPSITPTTSSSKVTNHQKIVTTTKNIKAFDLIDLPVNPNTQRLVPKALLTTIERKIFAIAKGDWKAIKFISQQLDKTDLLETKILDALSQYLFEMQRYNLDNEQKKVLILICRKLGYSKNGRYKSTLQKVANQTTDQNLSKYAKSASNKLTQPFTEYVIGSINFKQIIDEFKL